MSNLNKKSNVVSMSEVVNVVKRDAIILDLIATCRDSQQSIPAMLIDAINNGDTPAEFIPAFINAALKSLGNGIQTTVAATDSNSKWYAYKKGDKILDFANTSGLKTVKNRFSEWLTIEQSGLKPIKGESFNNLFKRSKETLAEWEKIVKAFPNKKLGDKPDLKQFAKLQKELEKVVKEKAEQKRFVDLQSQAKKLELAIDPTWSIDDLQAQIDVARMEKEKPETAPKVETKPVEKLATGSKATVETESPTPDHGKKVSPATVAKMNKVLDTLESQYSTAELDCLYTLMAADYKQVETV